MASVQLNMVHPMEPVGGNLQVLDDEERMIDRAVVAPHKFSNGGERQLHFVPENIHQALPGFHPFALAVSALHIAQRHAGALGHLLSVVVQLSVFVHGCRADYLL